MIPLLTIPFYNRADLLARCVASIDYPVEHLVIVQNGKEEIAFVLPELVKKLTVIAHPNAGVAASWNEAIKLFPADYWLIANNDIAFAPGDLEKMHNAVTSQRDAGCFYGNHGASWFAITPHGVDTVGLFDENFFPAYLEDCDWSCRADLLGVPRVNVADTHAIHGDGAATGSCTIMSNPQFRSNTHHNHGRNFEYYRRKWGGNNGQETFKTPFNDPHWPIWAWKFETEFRKGQIR